MDELTQQYASHYARTFSEHGATAAGVDWGAEADLEVRYDKMLSVLRLDKTNTRETPTLLDAGCGWGGLWNYAKAHRIAARYTGIDLVPEMVNYAQTHHADAQFICGDLLSAEFPEPFDYVICNGILTLKLTASIRTMEAYAKGMIRRLYKMCRRGIAFNMMSTRVNFMAPHLYYQNPAELLSFCLSEISPLVAIDHSYTSLGTGRGKLYEFTTYIFRPDAGAGANPV
jgi:2-polyprenyl-3-methyl-5-hydroxy-6-metoxy-1,4-benzoquinol methylase